MSLDRIPNIITHVFQSVFADLFDSPKPAVYMCLTQTPEQGECKQKESSTVRKEPPS